MFIGRKHFSKEELLCAIPGLNMVVGGCRLLKNIGLIARGVFRTVTQHKYSSMNTFTGGNHYINTFLAPAMNPIKFEKHFNNLGINLLNMIPLSFIYHDVKILNAFLDD